MITKFIFTNITNQKTFRQYHFKQQKNVVILIPCLFIYKLRSELILFHLTFLIISSILIGFILFFFLSFYLLYFIINSKSIFILSVIVVLFNDKIVTVVYVYVCLNYIMLYEHNTILFTSKAIYSFMVLKMYTTKYLGSKIMFTRHQCLLKLSHP